MQKMKIETISVTPLETNCYLISEKNAAVVIDPGEYSLRAADFLRKNESCERLIILTHAHFDHIGGAARLREETDTPIAIGAGDFDALSDPVLNLSAGFGMPVEPFSADIALHDGELLKTGDIEFKIIETPGHTRGGICLLAENALFSGDTLFAGSVGRTDFPGGNTAALLRSVKERIAVLPNMTRVYPGHGEPSSIEAEKRSNPYLGGII